MIKPPVPKTPIRSNLGNIFFGSLFDPTTTAAVSSTKSYRKIIPLRSPLLRTMQEAENITALANVAVLLRNTLPPASFWPDQMYRNEPVNDNSEKRLSLYGAERNNPAGEMMCKHAVKNAIFAAFSTGVLNTNSVVSYNTSVDNKCEIFAIRIPLRA